MKHAMSAAVALALGLGLAVSAQAQGTAANTPTNQNTQATAPAPAMQPPADNVQAAQPTGKMQQARHARSMRTSHHANRAQIKQQQRQLKAAGLYRGHIDGIAGPKTKRAMAELRSQQQTRFATTNQHQPANRMTGSSMPRHQSNATMQPPVTQAPNAGGNMQNPTQKKGY